MMSNLNDKEQLQLAFVPEIRRARFDRLTIYEITDAELALLESGSPDSIYLNFAIFLLSVAASITVTLATTSTPGNALLIVFVVCAVVGFTLGALLLLLWRKNRSAVSECVSTIRMRLPPEGTCETLPPTLSNLGDLT